MCPNGCVNDLGLGKSVCEQTGCTLTSDCAEPRTFCSAGDCNLNFCVADAQGNALTGSFGQSCTADDAGSGTCLPQSLTSGLCTQGGTAAPGGACTPNPVPSLPAEAAQLCTVGSTCETVGDGGVCYSVGDGGCVVNLGNLIGTPNTEIFSCTDATGFTSSLLCQCSSLCRFDTAISSSTPLCETPCAADSDCPLSIESCNTDAGYCSFNFCVIDILGNSLSGTINGDCAPMDAGGGCFLFGNGVSTWGDCLTSGDAGLGSPCDPLWGRGVPDLMCTNGLVCLRGALNGTAVCEGICIPGTDGGCGANEQCVDYTGGRFPDAGLCCLPLSATCTTTQACCSGSCGDGGTCCSTIGIACATNQECCSGNCDTLVTGTCL
jgi:hypothetical protein